MSSDRGAARGDALSAVPSKWHAVASLAEAAADLVTASNDEDGVAQAVEQILGGVTPDA